MSETEGAALQFFVCRTTNDYQDRIKKGAGRIKTTTKNNPNLVIKSICGKG